MTEKNNGYASFGGRGLIKTTPCISCLTKNITKQGAVMANFGEVMSKFYTLGRNKGLDNGLYLHTLMLFHSMCHLKEGEMSVENANKKFADLYGTFLNSASIIFLDSEKFPISLSAVAKLALKSGRSGLFLLSSLKIFMPSSILLFKTNAFAY